MSRLAGYTASNYEIRYHILEFGCMDCLSSYLFYVEVNKREEYVRKVGQVPPYITGVPSTVRKQLGDDGTDLYHKGLMCLSQGYGIAANSYFRRILEDQLTPILSRVLQLRKSEGASAEELQKIQGAIDEHDFSAKTRIAYEIAPPSLKPPAGNPFKILHDNYSAGLHSEDEATNIEIATNLRDAIEFIIEKLNYEIQSHHKFGESLKRVAQSRGRKPSE